MRGLFRCYPIMILLGFLFPVWAQTKEQTETYSVQGSVTLGTFVIPYQSEWFPLVGMDLVTGCQGKPFCEKYPFSFLRTHLDMAFSNNPYLENGYTRPKEYHLPYMNFTLQGAEIRFRPWLQVAFGKVQILRASRILYNDLNIQVDLAHARFEFQSALKSFGQAHCFLEVGGPGAKYVQFAAFQSVPFAGIDLLFLQQGCQMALGTKQVSGIFGYRLQPNVSVGQSGDRKLKMTGHFGSFHSEYRFDFQAGIQVKPPNVLEKAGIAQFRFLGQALLRFDVDQGCFPTGPASCGNNTYYKDIQLGLQLNIDFMSKAAFQNRKGLLLPMQWPGFAL